MRYYELNNGHNALRMPVLALGTATFDRKDCDAVYFEFLDQFAAAGGTCIDTARNYCNWVENGADASETVIGKWMEARGNRQDIVLVTKGGQSAPRREEDTEPPAARLSQEELTADLQRSLEMLRTDYIDIYFLHRDDPNVPVEAIMPVLDGFVKSGKVRFLGASNWKTERIEAANRYAAANGLEPFRISQIYYSLAHASRDTFGDDTIVVMDLKEFVWYQKHQFPVMAFSPQAKGFFSKLAKGESVSHLIEGQFVSAANLARLARVKEMSQKTGYTPAMITLGYLSSQPFPITSVFAVTKLWQLEENMKAQDLVFDKSTLAQLENII